MDEIRSEGIKEYKRNDIVRCTNTTTHFVVDGLVALVHNTVEGKAIGLCLYGEDEMILPYKEDCEIIVISEKAKLLKMVFSKGVSFTNGEKYLMDKLQEAWVFLAIMAGANIHEVGDTRGKRFETMLEHIKNKSKGKEYKITQECLGKLLGCHRESVTRYMKILKGGSKNE
jgi:hypothetical protein